MENVIQLNAGEQVRKAIKDMKITNGYVIAALHKAGFEMSETRFSNKLGGLREQFTDHELKAVNKILKIK